MPQGINKTAFLAPNDPRLQKIAQAVTSADFTTDSLKKDIEHMLKVAYGEQTDSKKPLLVGLAAPQIGIAKRIILVDIKANGTGMVGDLRLYINPEIVEKSQEEAEWYEGCFSTAQVCGIVSRPIGITVKALTQEGKEVIEKYTGYVARIFQHEIDHLNGIEFVSHIKVEDKLHWVEKDEFVIYRNMKGWRNWPNKCTFAKWQKIKYG